MAAVSVTQQQQNHLWEFMREKAEGDATKSGGSYHQTPLSQRKGSEDIPGFNGVQENYEQWE